MLNKVVYILNFDDSVIKQRQLISRYQPEIIDFKDIGPSARLWLNKKTAGQVRRRISALDMNAVTFLGSGDFHHISEILVSRFQEPISLIVFDFHPDWDALPPRLGCGSWITQALRSKNILKCILAGVSSADISSGGIQSGSLSLLKDNRLEIYPYQHRPSLVFLRAVPANISLRSKRGLFYHEIYWNEMRGKNLADLFTSVLKNIPTKKVYVSIDKDCLTRRYAFTNWEEGLISLPELLTMLGLIRERLDIVGLDITGDYSEISIPSRLKALVSRLDHPKEDSVSSLPASLVSATNEATNLEILQSIKQVF